MEEQFFLWYNLNTPPWDANRLVVLDRKWFIKRFVEQKEKESEAQQRAIQKNR